MSSRFRSSFSFHHEWRVFKASSFTLSLPESSANLITFCVRVSLLTCSRWNSSSMISIILLLIFGFRNIIPPIFRLYFPLYPAFPIISARFSLSWVA